MDASKFLDLAKTLPIKIPRNTNGRTLCTLKCANENATALMKIAQDTDMYRVKDGNKKPLNNTSSQIGAQTVTTRAYKPTAIGSFATIDCSTLDTPICTAGRAGTRIRFTLDKMLTNGKRRQPSAMSSSQLSLRDEFSLKLNLNQPEGRGLNLERQ
jgi:hypothetical protein